MFWSDYSLQPKDTADLLMPADGHFHPAELADCPEPVRRYLMHSIEPGRPRLRSVRLDMVGHIKIGRWLPFRAHELLTPHHGFVWRARVAGVIVGSDRFSPGSGGMIWKLAGLIPFVRTSGPDVARSAAGRAGGEALWLPTALLPRFGVAWTAHGTHSIVSSFTVDDVPLTVRSRIDDTGAMKSFAFDRWGDPDNTGTWGWHPLRRRGYERDMLRSPHHPVVGLVRLALRHQPVARRRVLPLPHHGDDDPVRRRLKGRTCIEPRRRLGAHR